jgi:hypothetical protein
MPVYCMGLALDEARRVVDEAEGQSSRIMSTVEWLRRPGD